MSEEYNAAKIRELSIGITKKLASEGKIIEGGWQGYRMLMSPNAGATQVNETRMAFYAGAHHLFNSILTVLQSGAEATEQDVANLGLIQFELDTFIAQFRAKHGLKND